MTAFPRLAALLGACVLLSACPKKEPEELVPDGSGFPLEFVTPPVEGGDPRVLQHVEAMGDSVYLDTVNVFVSFDKRRTWKELNVAGLGYIQKWVFVTPTSGIALTGKHGLAYIQLDTDIIYYLHGEPAWSAWALRGNDTLFTVRQEVDLGSRQVGDETSRVWLGRRRNFTEDAPWPEMELPPLPFSHRTYQPSVHFTANGDIYVASYFGLQVSRDDGQSWQQVPVLPNEQGSISWSGVDLFVTRAGTIFARTPNTTFVSHDGGASWGVAAMPGGNVNRDSMMTLEEPVPGELHFRDVPYRSTDEGRSYQQIFTLERYATNRYLETLFYRGGEYYFHMGLLSNFVSAAPDTSLSILNPRQGATVAPSNLLRAFPMNSGRYVGLWNQGLITYTPGDLEWKVERFFPNTRFLEKLRDGRLALARVEGLSFSRDEGATWSAPVPISMTSTNSVSVKTLVETQGRLVVSGTDSSHCSTQALMESRDEGATWQVINVERIFNPQQVAVGPSYKVELTAADRNGQLLGFAADQSGCQSRDAFTVSSTDGGRSWTGSKDRRPLASTSQIVQPAFIHVDGADHVYFVDGHRVLKSARLVH